MKFSRIPNTDLRVSRIALGSWPFSGSDWGRLEEEDCIRTTKAAFGCGTNFIDTAPIYGLGRAERIVGKAIQGQRDKVILATKCGLQVEGGSVRINLKPDFLRREIEDSLTRLGTDFIDLYQPHWPDPKTPLEETLGELNRFRKEGKIRHIGVANFSLELLQEAAGITEVSTIQNQYSLLKRESENGILPFCAENNIGFLAYGPLAGGILTGKYKEEATFQRGDPRTFFYRFYKGDSFKRAQEVVRELVKSNEASETPPVHLALSWVLGNPAVVSAIVGAKSPDQIRMNAESADCIPAQEDPQSGSRV